MGRIRVLVRGGGDLGTAISYRLFRGGLSVFIAEVEKPTVERRKASFAEAVYEGKWSVEGVKAVRFEGLKEAFSMEREVIPVLIDPELKLLGEISPEILIDARMLKRGEAYSLKEAPLIIGLGPGFEVGVNCHCFVETCPGPQMGRVYWEGKAIEDTRKVFEIAGLSEERVVRAPCDGVVEEIMCIGNRVKKGDLIARVDSVPLYAPIDGYIYGLLKTGVKVKEGKKVAEILPIGEDPRYICSIADRSMIIAGGVMEAVMRYILSKL